MTVGITAGAEDVKYQTKYKDLKRKVKDIETVKCNPSDDTAVFLILLP